MGIGPYEGRETKDEGRGTRDEGRHAESSCPTGAGDGRRGCQGMSQPRRFRDCFHWRTRRQAVSMSDSERVPSAMAESTAGIWVW